MRGGGGEHGELLRPGFVAVDVGEGGDFPAAEDVQSFVELGFAAGGEPDELRYEGGADDGGFLAFYQADGFVGVPGKQAKSAEN